MELDLRMACILRVLLMEIVASHFRTAHLFPNDLGPSSFHRHTWWPGLVLNPARGLHGNIPPPRAVLANPRILRPRSPRQRKGNRTGLSLQDKWLSCKVLGVCLLSQRSPASHQSLVNLVRSVPPRVYCPGILSLGLQVGHSQSWTLEIKRSFLRNKYWLLPNGVTLDVCTFVEQWLYLQVV